MGHYTEDELILYYYGDGRRRGEVERHLDTCGSCAAQYRAIADTLQLASALEVPERGDAYPLEVWQRIRARLPEQEASWWTGWFAWKPLTTAAVTATLIVAAFVAGRLWPSSSP